MERIDFRNYRNRHQRFPAFVLPRESYKKILRLRVVKSLEIFSYRRGSEESRGENIGKRLQIEQKDFPTIGARKIRRKRANLFDLKRRPHLVHKPRRIKILQKNLWEPSVIVLISL